MIYSAKNNSDKFFASYCETYFSAFLMHDIDVNGEWVKVQHSIMGETEESTPIREYRLYSTRKPDQYGDTRDYFMFRGRRIHTDLFMRRG